MEKDIIYFFGNNEVMIKKLSAYFNKRNYTLKKYDLNQLDSVHYLLLIEPYSIQGNYFDIHRIFRNYFEKESSRHSKLKLLVAGFDTGCDCRNYLNLLDMPSNIDAFLLRAGVIREPWKIRPSNGDLIAQLDKFFMGHHRVSLFQRLNYLQFGITNIKDAIEGNIEGQNHETAWLNAADILRTEMDSFTNRWRNYSIYFECCPFHQPMKEVQKLMGHLRSYIFEQSDQSVFERYDCPRVVADIRKELVKMQEYVQY
ncbi:MAG: hypothetical protein AAF990_09215 [Bacteroidota bacterium]